MEHIEMRMNQRLSLVSQFTAGQIVVEARACISHLDGTNFIIICIRFTEQQNPYASQSDRDIAAENGWKLAISGCSGPLQQAAIWLPNI